MQAHNVTSNVALTTTPAIVDEIAEAIPGQLAFVSIPQVTGLAAGATVTVTIQRVDTGANIGAATATNTGAGAGACGPITVVAAIPAGMAGAIQVNAVVSSGTGTASASATAPIVTGTLP